jgi:hypothetical protein
MVTKYMIDFRETAHPITTPITKFGGQPVWIAGRQWPINSLTQRPLRFICQIDLVPNLFGASLMRMAYVFMSDGAEDDGGVVVTQPGTPPVPVREIDYGPSLYRMVPGEGRYLVEQPCEFAVDLIAGEDYPFVHQVPINLSDQLIFEDCPADYDARLAGNKIGGTPLFLHRDDLPIGKDWTLLLQLDATRVPFDINFGDAGMGFIFLNTRSGEVDFYVESC